MNIHVGPVLASALLHIVVLGAFFFSWNSNSEPKRVTPPKYIEAKLVKLETQSKSAPSKKQAKKIDLTKRKKAEAERQAKIAAEKQAEAKRLKDAKEKAEREQREKAERQRREKERLEEQQRQKMLADLEKAKQEEEAALNEQRMAEEAQSFIDAISQKIENNWSRPPSARNGMTCELLIQLVPTGRVVSVSITKSSGNSAFDRSAEQAVKKAEVFPVVKQMSPDVFERYYRRLNLIFNPQDLRQ